MKNVEDMLGKPFIAHTGRTLPDYALPIINAYYANLPTNHLTTYTPVTPEVAKETVLALEKTLKRLNDGTSSRDLKLLPTAEFHWFKKRKYSFSNYEIILPKLPTRFSVKGTVRHNDDYQEIMLVADAVWEMIKYNLDLPHWDTNYTGSDTALYRIVNQEYKRSLKIRTVQSVLVEISASLILVGLFMILAFAINSLALSFIALTVGALLLIPILASWDFQHEHIFQRRLKKCLNEYTSEPYQQKLKQELESFILQTQ